MDSAVIPLQRYPNFFLVQTVDFFYPLADDPYLMGKIALANVVSDIYATGVTKIDKIKMILSSPTEFTEQQRDLIIPKVMKGFYDAAKSTDCAVEVQSVTINPWCIIGGVATAVVKEKEIIFPNQAQPGDVLILTKPLGTQLASNSMIWLTEKSSEWDKISNFGITEANIVEMFNQSVEQMCLLNLTAAELMHKYNAHGATDITGFGLLGHAGNLVSFQKEEVNFIIHTLPILKTVKKVAEALGRTQKLFSGNAVETSGGLLLAVPEENVEKFCQNYQEATGFRAFTVGKVEEGSKVVKLEENFVIIEV